MFILWVDHGDFNTKTTGESYQDGEADGWKYTGLIVYFRPRYRPSATQRNEATP